MNARLDDNPAIAFIGAGRMATALIDGLLAAGAQAGRLRAADIEQGRLAPLARKGLNTSTDNAAILAKAEVAVLAVKPQLAAQVLTPLKDALRSHDCLLLSIAAGIDTRSLQAWTHPRQAIVRCMPNTPALARVGASALFANEHASERQKKLAAGILNAVGITCWLADENDMDAVTALSGSGPAYFFLLMEAMQKAAANLGLAPAIAARLCAQTALGAATLALESEAEIADLRHQVTSPGGTTEAALAQLRADHFEAIVGRALERAAQRSRELAP